MKHHQISKFFQPTKRKPSALLPKNEPIDLTQSTEPEPKKQRKNSSQFPINAKVTAKPKSSKLTPLETQILELKLQHEDMILAIQVGYKYKFFGSDAATVSKIINIMHIPSGDSRFDYCSIPDNRLHVHLKRLLSFGYKVGVVKQTELTMTKATESSKGLFSRRLSGVYTLATYMNEESDETYGRRAGIDDDNGLYVCCICKVGVQVGVVVVRPQTGEIIVDTFEDSDLLHELETRLIYFMPTICRILCNDEQEANRVHKMISLVNRVCQSEIRPIDEGSLGHLEDFFSCDFLQPNELYEYFKLNFNQLVLNCISELVKYLQQFGLESIFTVPSNIERFKNNQTMVLSGNILRTLEIFHNSTDGSARGSLIWLLNHTRTKMGERLLYQWVSRPLVSRIDIIDRINAIDDLSKEFSHFIDLFKKLLSNDIDLEKSLIKLHYSLQSVKISRSETFEMLCKFNDILTLIKQFEIDIKKSVEKFSSKGLKSMFTDLITLANEFDIRKLYLNMISTSFGSSSHKVQKLNYFNLRYHNWEEISYQLKAIEDVQQQIDQETKEIGDILGRKVVLTKNLNQENLVEVRNTQINQLPLDWVRINATKSVTRFRSPKLQKLNNSLIYNHELLDKACDKVFIEFLKRINENYFNFKKIIDCIAKFDCYMSLVVTKAQGVKPEIAEEDLIIEVKGFKNPIIDTLTEYITNDVSISKTKNRVSIITGPNMGGKSSYIKSIGILVIMNQIGCYLPCESARLSIFSKIFVRMGSVDNIIRGQSTFMVEMLDILQVLERFDDKSLILLDEVGRGTGTHDGYLMAYSILQHFCTHEFKPVILFITHFHKLAELAQEFDDVGNFYMDFIKKDTDEIVFLYKLVSGVLDNLYGLNVARMAGIPSEIVESARRKANEIRNDTDLKRITSIMGLLKSGNVEKAFDLVR